MVDEDLVDQRRIKSSIGIETHRPVIKTTLLIGRKKYPIEISLVNRDLMGYRMLLGRKALKELFLIDVNQSYLLSKKLK